MKQIILNRQRKESKNYKKYTVIVSNEDFDWLNQYFWTVEFNHGNGDVYARMNVARNKTVRLHRFILNAPDHLQVDHINGNTRDNRRENLRLCTLQQNNQNARAKKSNKSGYKGVSWDKLQNKWVVRIMFEGRNPYLGAFDSAHQAAMCYDLWARDIFGEFARTNFTSAL